MRKCTRDEIGHEKCTVVVSSHSISLWTGIAILIETWSQLYRKRMRISEMFAKLNYGKRMSQFSGCSN